MNVAPLGGATRRTGGTVEDERTSLAWTLLVSIAVPLAATHPRWLNIVGIVTGRCSAVARTTAAVVAFGLTVAALATVE